jgi:hypothetical protein
VSRDSETDRARGSRPDDLPIQRRLARSAWSVAAGVLVLLMLGSLAFLMVSSAPLWMWATPTAAEADPDQDMPAAHESRDITPD